MKGFRLKFLAIAAVLAAALFAGWYYVWRSITPDVRADFEWFQGLGFPDVKDRPLVRVATGQWYQSGGNARSNTYVNAFLLSTNANKFTVFTTKVAVQTFTNSAASTPEYQRVVFEKLKLRNAARAEAKRLEEPSGINSFPLFGLQPSEVTETFVLAWACWRDGLDREARQLYDEDRLLPKRSLQGRPTLRQRLQQIQEAIKQKWQQWTSRGNSQPPNPTLRQSVEKELATLTIWRAILAFQDKSITRPQLLQNFKDLLAHYPHCEYEKRAKDSIKILERMIAEDKAHQPVDAKILERMPVEQRVRELIFELRDQPGEQMSEPGSCSVFWNREGSTNTPAHQLVRIGYPAAPQLIAALDSDAFSRAVGFWRDFTFSHTVLSVGDCAEQILDDTSAGLCDFRSGSTNITRRQAAEKWWAEFQRKGERQMFIDAVEAGNRASTGAAGRLCEHFPEIAVQVLTNGIQNASETWVRTQLIQNLGNLKAAAAESFLRREMTNGPELQTRVEAADGLRNLGKRDALDAMIREWQRQGDEPGKQEEGTDELIRFLATANSDKAVAALKKDLGDRPVEVRYEVVDQIGEKDKWAWAPAGTVEKPSQATVEAEEEFLVSELDDLEQRKGMGISRGNISYSDPRICDEAALDLAERWPKRYAFDITKSLKIRERMRITCKNAWREAHHLSILPLPPESKLAALPPSLATQVTEIKFLETGAKPSPEYAAHIAQWKGKLLQADELVRLLTNFVNAPEPGCDGLEIEANKDEDLSGVQISIKLLSGASSTWSGQWSVNFQATVGNESLGSSSGSGITEVYKDASGWDDLREEIEKATGASAETPFSINVSLRRQP